MLQREVMIMIVRVKAAFAGHDNIKESSDRTNWSHLTYIINTLHCTLQRKPVKL